MDIGIHGCSETNPPGMIRDECTKRSLWASLGNSIICIFPIFFSPVEPGDGGTRNEWVTDWNSMDCWRKKWRKISSLPLPPWDSGIKGGASEEPGYHPRLSSSYNPRGLRTKVAWETLDLTSASFCSFLPSVCFQLFLTSKGLTDCGWL